VALFRRAGTDEWREHITLGKGERVLIASAVPAGWVVATTHALWLPERSGMARVGWETVDNASWNRDTAALEVLQAAALGARPRRWHLRMDDHRDLLLVIKERVRSTVVTTRQVAIDGERAVMVVARRPPGSDRFVWAVSVDSDVDVADAAVRATIEDALAGLRAELGQ
jgi:hypothetical protein